MHVWASTVPSLHSQLHACYCPGTGQRPCTHRTMDLWEQTVFIHCLIYNAWHTPGSRSASSLRWVSRCLLLLHMYRMLRQLRAVQVSPGAAGGWTTARHPDGHPQPRDTAHSRRSRRETGEDSEAQPRGNGQTRTVWG